MGFQQIVWVFIGGGIGSVLRFVLSKSLNPMFNNVFLGTLSVNIIGSFLIGLFLGYEIKTLLQKPMLLLLVTGFCGGFTTFSAFALEQYNLFKTEQYVLAITYILTTLILGIIAVGIGFYLAKQV